MKYEHLEKASVTLGNVVPQVMNTVDVNPSVQASDVLSLFSEYIVGYMGDSRGADKYCQDKNIGGTDVEKFLEYLFNLRLEQVSTGKSGSAYKDAEIPVCIYPLLESIGRYESDEEGVYIHPEGVNKPIRPSNHDEVVRGMRIAGFEFANSMPFAKAISSDLIFRLSVKDGIIYSSSGTSPVDPVTLLARVFYDFQELNSLYGTFRYSLGNVRMMGGALDALSRLGQVGKAIRP